MQKGISNFALKKNMSENKNIRNMLAEFFRYIRNELSGRERNSFERELQKDPFADEALDGFTTISESEATEDLRNLNERISKRSDRKDRALIYRIAGIVVLLIALSSVLILTVVKKPNNHIAYNSPTPKTIEIKKGQPIIESDLRENIILDKDTEEKKSFKTDDQNVTKGAAQRTDSIEKPVEIAHNNVVSESRAITSKEEASREMVVSAPMAAMARKKSETGYALRGKVLSTEDNLPIPGASVSIKGTTKGTITDTDGNFSINLPDSGHTTLTANYIGMDSEEINVSPGSQVEIRLNPSVSALSEVVVTGYGVKKSDAGEEELSDHIYPRPVTGKSKFNEYVRNNLHRPDNAEPGEKAVVVLSFLVRTSGEIDSIRVIRSPGKVYSDEAIRVIMSGPAWNPAEENGKPVEEDVRLRIVFR